MMRFLVALLAGVTLLAALPPARAQFQNGDREDLMSIYTLTISQELCGFEMSDAQADALGIASDKLEETLEMDEQAAQKLYDQVAQSLTAQKASGLCSPKGEAARNYRENLAKFAK